MSTREQRDARRRAEQALADVRRARVVALARYKKALADLKDAKEAEAREVARLGRAKDEESGKSTRNGET